jgi:hypothetical protein
MKIQVRSLVIALAIAVPIAVAATAKSSAAPINGTLAKEWLHDTSSPLA